MIVQKNPFTVRGRIRRCWLFTWRTPEETVRSLVPAPLVPETHRGFAFWNVVVCEISGMRPRALPASLGIGYWHAAYRLHVRARVAHGREVEGLHFIRSDCDRSIVAALGNVLTDFHFHTARIAVRETAGAVDGRIEVADASARFRIDRRAAPQLSAGSPFASVAEAAAFLKYKPCGLSPAGRDGLNAVRIVREENAWQSRVVAVAEQSWEFFAGRDVTPEVCCEVAPIDYEWSRGEILRAAP